MRKESFASKVAAGRGDMSPKATWWPRHVLAAARCIAVSSGDAPNGLLAARDSALDLASEWDAWLPEAAGKGAMRGHAALEIRLLDAARRNDERGVELDGDLLVENAAEQAGRLGSTVVSFPEERFRKLLEEHIRLFAAHVRLALERKDARPCARRAKANSLALADLTVEWF